MRVFTAILAVIVGSSAALAQSDPRANPATAAAPAAKADAKARAKSKSAHKKEAAKPKPDAEQKADAEKKGESAAKPKSKSAATSKSATTGSAAAGSPSAKPSGLQDTYAAIPPADRVAIQNDLTWGGDYSGSIDGEFSERLVQAVKAYQTRDRRFGGLNDE